MAKSPFSLSNKISVWTFDDMQATMRTPKHLGTNLLRVLCL